MVRYSLEAERPGFVRTGLLGLKRVPIRETIPQGNIETGSQLSLLLGGQFCGEATVSESGIIVKPQGDTRTLVVDVGGPKLRFEELVVRPDHQWIGGWETSMDLVIKRTDIGQRLTFRKIFDWES